MNESLKKYTELLPIFVPVIYILGFIVISGHLSKFGFNDYNLINFTYLKAGILVLVFISVVFISMKFSFSKTTMTDDLTKSWPSLILGISNILFITLITTPFLIDLNDLQSYNRLASISVIILTFIYLGFRIFLIGKTPKNNIGFLIIVLPSIFLLIIVFSILSYHYDIVKFLLIFNFTLTIIFFLALGDIGDKTYGSRIMTDSIILLAVCFFFGKYLYFNIPSKLGGGQPYEIVISKIDKTNELLFLDQQLDTLKVIYENDDRILVENRKKSIIFIDKGGLKAYEILKKSK